MRCVDSGDGLLVSMTAGSFDETTRGLINGMCEVECLKTCQWSGDGCDSKQQSFRYLK